MVVHVAIDAACWEPGSRRLQDLKVLEARDMRAWQ